MVDAVGTLTAYLVDWPGAAAALETAAAGGEAGASAAAASPSKGKSKGRKGELGVRRLEGFERREVWHLKWAEVSCFTPADNFHINLNISNVLRVKNGHRS